MKKVKKPKIKKLKLEEQVALLGQVHRALQQLQGAIPSLTLMPVFGQILNSIGVVNNSILLEIEKNKPKKRK